MQPVFYYDLASPYAYLAAERVTEVLPVTPVWQPILLGGIWQQSGGGSWAMTDARAEGMAEVERRAERYGLMPIRWPDPWPGNSLRAMRAATFAQQIGRAVAFSLAAFRQAFAAGRDLSDLDNVVIAARGLRAPPERTAQGDRDPVHQGPAQGRHGRGLRARRSRSADGRRRRPAVLRGRPARGGRGGARVALPPSGGDPGRRTGVRGAPGTVRFDVHKGSRQSEEVRQRRGGEPHPLAPGRGNLPPDPEQDAADPPLRGARGRDVRQGQGRRLPPPVHRRGGHHRRRHPGAARDRLPDVDLPRARPGARPRHPSQQRHGRAVRPQGRHLGRPRRLHAPVRRRAALPRRLRDRRRHAAALRGRGARRRLPGHRGRDPLDDGRRRHQPGHVRRDHEPRRALEAAGGLPDHQQPVRHGHRAPPPLGGDRPLAQVRGLRRARHEVRRHGRARRALRDHGRAPLRARGAQAAAGGGRDLPLPRPLHGRPRGVPHEGGGRGVAQARPDRLVLEAARGRGRAQGQGRRGARPGGHRGRGRVREVRRRLALPRPRLAVRRRVRLRRRRARLVDRGRALARAAPRRARARGRAPCHTSWPRRAPPTRRSATRRSAGARSRKADQGEGEPGADEPEEEGGAD